MVSSGVNLWRFALVSGGTFDLSKDFDWMCERGGHFPIAQPTGLNQKNWGGGAGLAGGKEGAIYLFFGRGEVGEEEQEEEEELLSGQCRLSQAITPTRFSGSDADGGQGEGPATASNPVNL